MKLERISDNQIRCTLNKQDLQERELRVSELAYGTEKAKELFRDMMQQASYELGFEAEDIPLMIEAIPVSQESLVLIITKVDDPDELDTRFSKFSTEEEDFYDGMAGKLARTFCSRTITNIEKAVAMIDRNVNSKIVFCDLVNRMFLSI